MSAGRARGLQEWQLQPAIRASSQKLPHLLDTGRINVSSAESATGHVSVPLLHSPWPNRLLHEVDCVRKRLT